MSARRWILFGTAAVLLLVVIVIVLLVLLPGGIGSRDRPVEPVEATNLGLDVRYSYDPSIFTPAPFNSRNEYPLRLDAEAFSFYGKRIRGLGKFLVKDPAPLLYDFVGSQHMESFEQWFDLELLEDPVYEDAQIGGHLGLHQRYVYRRTAQSMGWPVYFPDSVTSAGIQEEGAGDQTVYDRLAADSGVEIAYIEGWALFTANDLFFFQAIAPRELTPAERRACVDVLNSMQFDVLLAPSPAMESDKAGTPEAAPPAEDQPAVDEPAADAESDG